MVTLLGEIAHAIILVILLLSVVSIAVSLKSIAKWKIDVNTNIHFNADFAEQVAKDMIEIQKINEIVKVKEDDSERVDEVVKKGTPRQ